MIFFPFDYLKRNKKRLFPLAVVAVVTPLSGCLVFCLFYYYYYCVVIIIMPQECADCVLFFGGGAGEFVFRVVRALLFVTRMTMSKWIIPNGFIFWLFFPSLTEFQKFGFDGHIRIVSVCVRGWLFSFELLIFWLYNNIVLLDFCKVEWGVV